LRIVIHPAVIVEGFFLDKLDLKEHFRNIFERLMGVSAMEMLWKIERFLRDQDMPPTKFGRLVARDPRLVLDMRNGREPRPEMVDRIEAFIGASARRTGRPGQTGRAA
jgi:hypothetical protein